MKAVRKKLSDQSGQSTKDYMALLGLLMLIVVIAIAVSRPTKLQELWDGISSVSSDIRSLDRGQETAKELSCGCGEGLSWTVVPGDGGDMMRIEVDGEVVGCIPVEDVANAASKA